MTMMRRTELQKRHRIAARPSGSAQAPTRKRSVYLGGEADFLVDSDHIRLLLYKGPRERTCLPFTCIARIVTQISVSWTGRALGSCLANRVPLIWIDKSGACLGSAFPQTAGTSTLDEALNAYTELPAWSGLYPNWLKRRRLHVLNSWLQQAENDGYPISAQRVSELKRHFVYNNILASHAPAESRAWSHARVASHLVESGAQPRYWGQGGGVLELAEDLTSLLWGALCLTWGSILKGTSSESVALFFFENWMQRHDRNLDAHIEDLMRHVQRELHAWP
jgi:hypothetical protein